MQVCHQVINAGETLAFPSLKFGNGLARGGVGAFHMKGIRRSSAMRSISKRMASEMDNPIASSASAARSLVLVSMRAPDIGIGGAHGHFP